MRFPELHRWSGSLAGGAVLCLALVLPAQQPNTPADPGQQPPAVQQPPAQQPADSGQQPPAAQLPPAQQPGASPRTERNSESSTGTLSEDEMRKQFEGKTFYVRGGWLDNELHFNMYGKFVGNSPKASYTLSLVQITRVHLDKHHLDLEGIRYGLHFLGAAPFEDQAVDRVRLTSKKKPLHIVIDREEVVLPKKQKPQKPEKKKQVSSKAQASGRIASGGAPSAPVTPTTAASEPATSASSEPVTPAPSAPAPPAAEPSAPVTPTSAASEPVTSASSEPVTPAPSAPAPPTAEPSGQAAPTPSEPVQSPPSVPVTPAPSAPVIPTDLAHHGATVATSQAVSNQALRHATDAVFASGIDQSMIATLPAYWQLYYKDVDLKQDYHPSDPSILPDNQVDTKARLVSVFDPPSNEYAQKNGVAGMSMYHVVVQPDGKAGEVAIGRPIGFGLDESAVNAIRQAKFQPAIKEGKPVPVVLDLIVEFRIYSKLTDRAAAKPNGPQPPTLPGPYSIDQPQAQSQRQ